MLKKILPIITTTFLNLITWRSRQRDCENTIKHLQLKSDSDRLEIQRLKDAIKVAGDIDRIDCKTPIDAIDIKLQKKETDESKKIVRLLTHQDGIGWFIGKAKEKGIMLERTYDDDPKGDIFCPDPNDVEALKALASKLKEKYSK